MKTRLIKTTITSLLFACALVSLVTALALGTSGIARADGQAPTCGVNTLRGSYVFDAHGWNIVGGVAVPKAILEGIDFNADGTLVAPFVTVSINGFIIRASGTTGTYTVAEDCTGTVTFADGASYDTYVQYNGKQLWMIQTSAPGGTPAVFEGTAVKVSR